MALLTTIFSQCGLFLLQVLSNARLFFRVTASLTRWLKGCIWTMFKEGLPRSLSKKTIMKRRSSFVKINTLAAHLRYVNERHKAMEFRECVSALLWIIEAMV